MNALPGIGDDGAELVGSVPQLDEIMMDLHHGRAEWVETEVHGETEVGDLAYFASDPDGYEAWYRAARRQAVSFRNVVSARVARHPLTAQVAPITRGTVQWRVLPAVPLRVVVRRDMALSAIDPGGTNRGAMVITGSGRQGWQHYVDALWRTATPWSAAAAARDRSRRDAVVDLLLSGLDDEAIARRLEISVRTVRRHVADLMTEHQARSRFQLGATLAVHGG